MVEKTRALWVEFECGARHTGNSKPSRSLIKECDRFWATLPPDFRDAFVRTYKAYREAQNEYTSKSDDAHDTYLEARSVVINRTTDWSDYIAKHEQSAKAWRSAKKALGRLTRALQKLSRVIARLRRPTLNLRPVHPDVDRWIRDENSRFVIDGNTIDVNIASTQGNADTPPIPARRTDHQLKVPLEWVTENAKKARNIRRRKSFEEGSPADEDGLDSGNWHGARMFGEGAMALAGLWVRLDQEDYVDDRLVRKDTYWDQFDWGHVQHWRGDLRDPTARESFEIECHREIDGQKSELQDANSQYLTINVPRVRSSVVYDAEMLTSISMAYCPFGSLNELITEHMEEDVPIPEPFIWRTFHSLAEVGLAMEKGDAIRDAWALEGHEETIHRDLKPSNVFLADRTEQFFESYPTPMVSDFGLSFMTGEDDPFNPSLYVDGGGTRGFMAPEQASYVSLPDIRPIDRFQMLAHTNVFGVGMIIYCMAALKVNLWQPDFLGDGSERGDVHDAMAIKRYSVHLRSLIRDCIRFQPNRRPTWVEILERIDAAFDPQRRNLAGNLQDCPPVDMADRNALRHLPAEKCAMDMALDDLPELKAEDGEEGEEEEEDEGEDTEEDTEEDSEEDSEEESE